MPDQRLYEKCQKYTLTPPVYLLQPLCKGPHASGQKEEHVGHSRMPLNCVLCLQSYFHGRMQPERDLKCFFKQLLSAILPRRP